MTDLATVLAVALRKALGPPRYVNFGTFDLTDDDYLACAAWLIATPEGKALAALVEAALAWRDEDATPLEHTAMWPDVERNLAAAIDAYQEATR